MNYLWWQVGRAQQRLPAATGIVIWRKGSGFHLHQNKAINHGGVSLQSYSTEGSSFQQTNTCSLFIPSFLLSWWLLLFLAFTSSACRLFKHSLPVSYCLFFHLFTSLLCLHFIVPQTWTCRSSKSAPKSESMSGNITPAVIFVKIEIIIVWQSREAFTNKWTPSDTISHRNKITRAFSVSYYTLHLRHVNIHFHSQTRFKQLVCTEARG